MSDTNGAPMQNVDISNLQQTVIAAAGAKIQELKLSQAAAAAGDNNAQKIHWQAYILARKIDVQAEGILENNLLTAADAGNLAKLQDANQTLSSATTAIAATTSALNTFVQAANVVLKILSLFP